MDGGQDEHRVEGEGGWEKDEETSRGESGEEEEEEASERRITMRRLAWNIKRGWVQAVDDGMAEEGLEKEG